MTLVAVLVAMALLSVSGVVAFAARSDRAALLVGTAGAAIAGAIGAAASVAAILGGTDATLVTAWALPIGHVAVGIDALSAVFLLAVFVVCGIASIYGAGYLPAYQGRHRLAPAVAFFDLLAASMVGIVVARDAVLFLIAWEIMSVTSFFLVGYEDDREEVRRAAMTYLIASHLGTVFVFFVFGALARKVGAFGFAEIAAAGPPNGSVASVCFILALLGFGTKAGLWPVHVWLPEAHPAAPSHVSAVMSGVMIKMGIYGILRTLTLLGEPPAWWGGVAIAIGAVSAITGVLHALAQQDLKRLLAYSSVENVGIVVLGLGVGLLGQSERLPLVAFLGYAGALLHVLNHGLMKSLLFLSTGGVLHGTGTRDIERLGGLARRMPITALAFLVGAVAISGLPPLNGFVSEWLVYVGALHGGAAFSGGVRVAAVVVLPALALVGGLAAACFVKAFGLAFCGEPRTAEAAEAHESSPSMRAPMMALAALCVAAGTLPVAALRLVERAAGALGHVDAIPAAAVGPLSDGTRIAAVFVALAVALALVRRGLLRGRDVRAASTWGCGYAAPTPRMQYSGSSFASPVLAPFAPLVPKQVEAALPEGFFPATARYEERHLDAAGERVIVPAVRRVVRALGRLRVIQQGRVQLYLAYILVTLVALLVWQLAGAGGG